MTAIGAFLSGAIYFISAALFYPALILIVIFSALIVVSAGALLAEWLERVRLQKVPAEKLPGLILEGQEDRLLPHRVKGHIRRVRGVLENGNHDDVLIANLLAESRMASWKSTDMLKALVKLGPALGLIGTLIPMGKGLTALGQGDLTQMAGDLGLAFTTTVVGISVGMVAFSFFTIRHRWVQEDVKNLELATEVLMSRKLGAGE